MLKVDVITAEEIFKLKVNWKPEIELDNDWSDEQNVILSTLEESEKKGFIHEEF